MMPAVEIPQSFKSRILLPAFILAVITIPLYNQLNSISLIILVGVCLMQRPLPATIGLLRKPSLWILPFLYFIWMATSYFWDASGGFAVRDIERYSTLFFIPLIIAITPPLSQKFLKFICMSFVAVICLVCLICLFSSFLEYRVTQDYRVFFYHYLGGQMNLNAIFLANYCLASLLWLLYFSFLTDKRKGRNTTVAVCLLSVFLLMMILLLSSKLVIFLTLLSLLFLILYIGYLRGFFVRSLVIVSILIAGGIISVYNLSYVRWRMDVTSFKKYDGAADNNNGLAIRMLMWKNAWDLIRQRPVLGYGVRGARLKEVEVFKKENFVLAYEGGYHSHNQYLESALMGGIPAFLLFAGMLAGLWAKAFRQRNLLLVLLLFHFTCQCVIESAFEVQQELVFFIFFLFLFYYHPPSVRQKKQFANNGIDAVL